MTYIVNATLFTYDLPKIVYEENCKELVCYGEISTFLLFIIIMQFVHMMCFF